MFSAQEIISQIQSLNQPHFRYIQKNFDQDSQNFEDLKSCLEDYESLFEAYDISVEALTEAYLKLNSDMQNARIDFLKTGSYYSPLDAKKVYKDPEFMRSYMLGLLLSQFFWVHHYKMYKFYMNHLKFWKGSTSILEIGSGHGLYLSQLSKVIGLKKATVVDISEASLELAKEVYSNQSYLKETEISFVHSDVLEATFQNKFDGLICGEVLEHVSDPGSMLNKIKDLLNKDGVAFVTTCVNCPAIDHIYHFKEVGEIVDLIQSNGFEIVAECVAPSIQGDPDRVKQLKADVSYAAFLTPC